MRCHRVGVIAFATFVEGSGRCGTTTNTRRTKTYDNLIFQRTTTGEYTGRWGVLDLQNTYGLSLKQALEVSDHNPVWAAFTAREVRATTTASMPTGGSRH